MWVEEHHENDKEIVGLIRNLWKQVHVLTEQKLQLVPLSPFGIMAKWLCNKAKVTQNELMYDTLKRVWEVCKIIIVCINYHQLISSFLLLWVIGSEQRGQNKAASC